MPEPGHHVLDQRVADDVERHRARGRIARRAGAPGAAAAGVYTRAQMRLRSDEIEFLARKIVKTLVSGEKLAVDEEEVVMAQIGRVITEELEKEDRLNDEVREVLVQHSDEMARSNITYTEMFKMVKRKMAKEKGLIL
jgi:hypothetical protein